MPSYEAFPGWGNMLWKESQYLKTFQIIPMKAERVLWQWGLSGDKFRGLQMPSKMVFCRSQQLPPLKANYQSQAGDGMGGGRNGRFWGAPIFGQNLGKHSVFLHRKMQNRGAPPPILSPI